MNLLCTYTELICWLQLMSSNTLGAHKRNHGAKTSKGNHYSLAPNIHTVMLSFFTIPLSVLNFGKINTKSSMMTTQPSDSNQLLPHEFVHCGTPKFPTITQKIFWDGTALCQYLTWAKTGHTGPNQGISSLYGLSCPFTLPKCHWRLHLNT